MFSGSSCVARSDIGIDVSRYIHEELRAASSKKMNIVISVSGS